MFELFTKSATKVVCLAQSEAIDIGYRSVGTEDFLRSEERRVGKEC